MTDEDASLGDEDDETGDRFDKDDVVIYEVPDGFSADNYPMLILGTDDTPAGEKTIIEPDGDETTMSELHEGVDPAETVYKTQPLMISDDDIVPVGEAGFTPESHLRDPEQDQ